MTHSRRLLYGETAKGLLFPRRCPFCDVVLGSDAVLSAFCPDCAAEEERLRHTPPRLPESEHCFYAVSGAASAYYYSGAVRAAILRCKAYDHPWYARELADLMLCRIWGAEPAPTAAKRPTGGETTVFPQVSAVVPVPPRQPLAGTPTLPRLLAERLGGVMERPVIEALHPTRILLPQKELTREQRLQNTKDAYACTTDLVFEGQYLLLVDDVITTGATISACAKALLQAGAAGVFAVGIAADEELPKKKQKRNDTKK